VLRKLIWNAYKNLPFIDKEKLMLFDPDDFVPYKGGAFTRESLFHKVKGLGWTAEAFKQLEDEQVRDVLDNRKGPGQITVKVQEVATKIDLDKLPEDPNIMGLGDGSVEERVVTPPAPTRVLPPPNTRLQVVNDPTKQMAPVVQQQKPITVRPPRTTPEKILPILDAAYQLSLSDASIPVAKSLLQSNGLERVFQSLYPDNVKKVLGRVDTSPIASCVGGVILDVEIYPEDGFAHIVTTSGTITLEGFGIKQKENK
jgi:hypothetical protein